VKSLISTLSIAATALLITGCVGSEPRVEYNAYKPSKQVEIKSENIIKVTNGRLEYKGDSIMDENGDIAMAFNIDGDLYYFVTKESAEKATYLLKNAKGEVVKSFEGRIVHLLRSEENLPLIMVQLSKGYGAQVYDNVYKFDGKEVKLVNKNLQLYRNEFFAAGHQFITKISKDGNFRGQYFPAISVVNGKEQDITTSHPGKLFGTPMPHDFNIIATAGGNVVYTYSDQNGDKVIETYNLKTAQQAVLAKPNDKLQLLQSGTKKVLRIFTDTAAKVESSIVDKNIESAQDGMASVFIDLATLDEVKINLNDFEKLRLESGYANMGGGYTRDWYITYNTRVLHKISDKRRGKPIF
jgi:hypothetical protein